MLPTLQLGDCQLYIIYFEIMMHAFIPTCAYIHSHTHIMHVSIHWLTVNNFIIYTFFFLLQYLFFSFSAKKKKRKFWIEFGKEGQFLPKIFLARIPEFFWLYCLPPFLDNSFLLVCPEILTFKFTYYPSCSCQFGFVHFNLPIPQVLRSCQAETDF